MAVRGKELGRVPGVPGAGSTSPHFWTWRQLPDRHAHAGELLPRRMPAAGGKHSVGISRHATGWIYLGWRLLARLEWHPQLRHRSAQQASPCPGRCCPAHQHCAKTVVQSRPPAMARQRDETVQKKYLGVIGFWWCIRGWAWPPPAAPALPAALHIPKIAAQRETTANPLAQSPRWWTRTWNQNSQVDLQDN